MNKLKKVFAALSSKEKIAFVAALAVFALSLMASLGLAVRANTALVPAEGGLHREGEVGQPVNINPVLASSELDKSLVRLVFASIPDIAEKIETDEVGRVWNVRLKEGLLWSDGQKLTSDDVIFTVERLQDPESKSPYLAQWQGVSVSRKSELELEFLLSKPYPLFSRSLETLFPVPKHIFANTPTANWKLSKFIIEPVGSGPYVFVSRDEDQTGFISEYRMRRNENFSGSRPYVSEMVFKFFPNKEELLAEFNSGLLDGIADLDPLQLANVKRPYKLVSFEMPSYYAVFFNQAQNPALRENAVRKALNAGLDRAKMVDTVFQGQALIKTSPVFLSPTATSSKEDAVKILENAGWKVGEEGYREKTVNKSVAIPLQFTMTVPEEVSFLMQTANEIAEQWRAIGAKVDIQEAKLDELVNRAIRNREYQALLFGNILNPSYDLYPFWDSTQRFYPGLNFALYNNSRADELIEGVRTAADEDTRARRLADLGEIIDADAPAAILYSPKYLYLVSKDTEGISTQQIREPSERFAEVESWYVRTARTIK